MPNPLQPDITPWATPVQSATQSPLETLLQFARLKALMSGGQQSQSGQQSFVGSDGRRYINPPAGSRDTTDYSKTGGANDPRYFQSADFFKPGMDEKGQFDWEKFVRAHADSPVYPGLMASAQFNMTTPQGRSVPVQNYAGFDPTRGTWDEWRRKFGVGNLPPVEEVKLAPGVPPYGSKPFDALSKGAGKMSWGPIFPYLETDSNTGLPARYPGPGTDYNAFFMGGPKRGPYSPSQIFNDPSHGGGNIPVGQPHPDNQPYRVPVLPPLLQSLNAPQQNALQLAALQQSNPLIALSTFGPQGQIDQG